MSRWTEAQTARAFELREAGMQYKDIGDRLGKSKHCVFVHMQRHADRRRAAGESVSGPSAGQLDPEKAHPAALQEREERLKQLPRDLTALLMGDPMPTQSALHQKSVLQSGNAARPYNPATCSSPSTTTLCAPKRTQDY